MRSSLYSSSPPAILSKNLAQAISLSSQLFLSKITLPEPASLRIALSSCFSLLWQAITSSAVHPSAAWLPPSAAWPPCSFSARPIRLPSSRKRGPPPLSLFKKEMQISKKILSPGSLTKGVYTYICIINDKKNMNIFEIKTVPSSKKDNI